MGPQNKSCKNNGLHLTWEFLWVTSRSLQVWTSQWEVIISCQTREGSKLILSLLVGHLLTGSRVSSVTLRMQCNLKSKFIRFDVTRELTGECAFSDHCYNIISSSTVCSDCHVGAYNVTKIYKYKMPRDISYCICYFGVGSILCETMILGNQAFQNSQQWTICL